MLAFTRYMMPSPDANDNAEVTLYEDAKHHRVLAAALEEVEAGRIMRLAITMPPRHGKTLLASRMFPAWYMGRHPDHHAIFATYSDAFASDGGRAVRDIMESPLYQHVFPGVRLRDDAAAMDRLEVEGGGALFFVGRRGGTTGRGANIVLIDDPIKDRQEADSPTIRERIWTWYTQVISNRLMNQDGRIIIIMTRWAEDDLVGRLTDPKSEFFSPKEARNWHMIDFPALALEGDVLGRKRGEALWPKRFNVSYLERQRTLDPRGFEALFQGSPTPAEGNFFKADSLKTYARLRDLPPAESLRYYAGSDHAVSTAQNRDKTCMGAVAVDTSGDIWVLPNLFWERAPADQAVEAMLAIMRQYQPLFWWAERGHISKSIGPFLRRRMLETSTFCTVEEIVPTGDKQQRAQSIQARMSMGKVRFPAFAPWWPEARDQILKFPHGVHDDLVDFLSMIGLGLSKLVPARRAKQTLQPPAVGSVAWLKGEDKDEKRRRRAAMTEGW